MPLICCDPYLARISPIDFFPRLQRWPSSSCLQYHSFLLLLQRQPAALSASLDGAAVSGSPDPHKFDKYVELSADLMARIRQLYDLKAEVEAGVMRLPAGTLREILLLRYVSVMTWEQIAVTMDLSYRHVCRLHDGALEEIKKILPMS